MTLSSSCPQEALQAIQGDKEPQWGQTIPKIPQEPAVIDEYNLILIY